MTAVSTQLAAALAAALAAIGRGWSVFPLLPGTKRPAIEAWEARATCDPDRVRTAWSTAPYGVGIACGPSGLLVVDLDVPKPGELPPEPWQRPGVRDGRGVLAAVCADAGHPLPPATYTVATPSGGTHLYYAQPASGQLRNTQGRIGWRVDTRGHGGYVVAAGTHLEHTTDHQSGAYTVVDDSPVGELPGWLVDRLTTPAPATDPTRAAGGVELHTGRLGAYVAAAIRTQVGHVQAAVQGRRNATLYMAAQNLGRLVAGGALDAELVQAVLLDAAADHVAAGAYTTRQAHGTIASGLRAGAKRPLRVAA